MGRLLINETTTMSPNEVIQYLNEVGIETGSVVKAFIDIGNGFKEEMDIYRAAELVCRRRKINNILSDIYSKKES